MAVEAFRIPSIASQDRFLAPLNRIREICNQYNIAALNGQIQACQKILQGNPFIDVAILGQFKAGKSSFLNSLIGKPVLPVGAIPVTTVITRLQYGEKERAVVRYFDGTMSEVRMGEVEEFTSEAKNPANQKNVEVVDVELPELAPYAGLRLVDTPGLGSVFQYHRETAENWLPEVGAAVLAVSADRPLSAADLNLIRDLMPHTPRVILLLTKVDLLSAEQEAEVLQFFRETLNREFRQAFSIFPYSTRRDTGKFKSRLEKDLLFPLSANRRAEREGIQRHKVRSLGRSCLGYLEIALKVAAQADQDREHLRQLILDDKVNYEMVAAEMFPIARENAVQTRLLIMKRLEDLYALPLRKRMKERLAREMPAWKGNLWKLTRRYEEWLLDTLNEELGRISRAEYRHFLGTLHKAHAGLSRSLEIFRTLLSQNVEKVLGVKMAEVEWQIEVSEPSQPDIKTSRIFDHHLDLIWFVIPMFIFRRVFEKHYLDQVSGEVEVNLSRLAAQWETRINKTIEGMKKQALGYVKVELSTIEAMLSRTSGRTDEIRQTIEELREQQECLAA